MQTIPYTDSRIAFAGRWIDSGGSKGSYWQASQVRFKVFGSAVLAVTASVQTADIAFAVVNIDSGPTNLQYFTQSGVDGVSTLTFALGTGEHEIVLKLGSFPDPQFAGTTFVRLVSVGIDDAATLTAWGNSAPLRIGVVGDSWMGCENDWPRLMDTAQISTYPTSYGGATAAQLNARYDYDGSGILNTSDPVLDAVVINSSVNDLTGGVSGAAFEASMSALVDKVQAKHPGVPVILLQSPRNVGTGALYDSYGTNMQNIVAAKVGVFFAPITATQWGSYVWADPYHLTFASLQVLAGYYESQILAILPAPATYTAANIFYNSDLVAAMVDGEPTYATPTLLIRGSGYSLHKAGVATESVTERKLCVTVNDQLFTF